MSGSSPRPARRNNYPRAGGVAPASQPLSGAISFEEWRSDVDERMDRHDTALQKTAVILERLSNRFDEHDRRIGLLETRPQRQQETIFGLGGLLGQYIYLVIAALLLWLAVSPHWH